ncbi:MAG: hypothetical protein KTR30_09850 [Saprospiraceae bacterium]|nr:hypothetical protein [Saprospiraceae bacterium]
MHSNLFILSDYDTSSHYPRKASIDKVAYQLLRAEGMVDLKLLMLTRPESADYFGVAPECFDLMRGCLLEYLTYKDKDLLGTADSKLGVLTYHSPYHPVGMKNFSKQLAKYLIEITIIIIGVIIAFYFTKYGEQLNRNQNERDVIAQIYFELEDNLNDLEADFLIHRIGLFSHLNVINYLDGKKPYSDSLIMDFYWITRDEYIFANVTGYENLKTFGINLIKDDSLRNLVTLVYNHDFPRLAKGSTLHPDLNAYLSPFYQEHFMVNRDTSLEYTLTFPDSLQISYPRDIGLGVKQIIGYVPIDPAALRRNEEFRFLITNALEFRMYKFSFYRSCIDNVKEAMQRIKELY